MANLENLIRKEFTISERVAIGKSMAARLGERRGRPGKEIPQNFGELKGRETAELAAEHAGFGNPETYRQAEKVCDEGVPELVELMLKLVQNFAQVKEVKMCKFAQLSNG